MIQVLTKWLQETQALAHKLEEEHTDKMLILRGEAAAFGAVLQKVQELVNGQGQADANSSNQSAGTSQEEDHPASTDV